MAINAAAGRAMPAQGESGQSRSAGGGQDGAAGAAGCAPPAPGAALRLPGPAPAGTSAGRTPLLPHVRALCTESCSQNLANYTKFRIYSQVLSGK